MAGIAGAVLAFGMQSCTTGWGDLLEDDFFTLVASTDFFKTSVNVQVENATGSSSDLGLGNGTQLKVHIKGANASDIYFQDGKTTVGEDIVSNSGNVTFHLDPNLTPTDANPVEFTLVFEADGFITTSKSYKLTQNGNILNKISMVDVSSPPMGVIASSGSGSLLSGTTTEEITLNSSDGGSGASLVIPEGTVMKDADGNPLSGDISIDMVYFNNEEESSLSVFPGGLMTNVIDESGNDSEGTFSSAGFVAIEISDENGNHATNFENNTISVEVTVSGTTHNPVSQANAAAGNEVPLWSYDESTGEWTYETMDTLVMGGNGSLVVTGELEHLSYWNFGWFSEGFCEDVPVNITSSQIPTGTNVYVEAAMYKAVDNTFLGSSTFYAEVGGTDIVHELPSGMEVIIKATDFNDAYLDVTFDDVNAANICDGNTTLDVTWSTEAYYTTFDVKGLCDMDSSSEGGTEIRPTFYFNYLDITDDGVWKLGQMVDGIAYLFLDPSHSYEVLADYAGESYSTTISLDGFAADPSQWGDFDNIVSTQDDASRTGTITADIFIPEDLCSQIE